ncbi:hypothetical protein GCM10008106_03390 [Mongoliitalea lutea]|uniref:PKD domain-containing protein n=2 Tax=Mongoliitalea lutea TaxID=849756 RepID=A0A8J3CTR2_9BACT|nr:hypothetical protein GCM10008106_03390 [Mongoliitalea lutea]
MNLSVDSNAQVRVPFKPRAPKADPTKTNYRINGDFLIIGNTNLTLEDYDDFKMNDNQMVYTSAFEGGLSGNLNSSGAELKFPQQAGVDHACTEILFAGLYWTGRSGESRLVTITDRGATLTKDKQQMTFQGPRLGERLNVLADENSIRFPEGLDNANDVGIFVGFQDVTDYVKFHGEGFYRGINLALLQGTNYFFGGWSLIVIYENPNLPLKDITVFDGYAYVRGDSPEEFIIPIDGIQTQEEGNVRVKVGIMAGEGDVAAEGDFFAIERGVGTNDFVPLSHEQNSPNNFFNSSINVGEPGRIPLLRNNTGMDLATFFIDNPNNELIANNQTSLRFKYGTTWDTYVIYNLAIAIDIDEPKIEGLHQVVSVNGQTAIPESLKPGDEVRLQVDIRNLGTEQLRSNRIELKLPRGVELVSADGINFQQPVTTVVNQSAGPNAGTRLYWDFGNLDPETDLSFVLARLSYTIRITENCESISTLCGATISLDGFLVGVQSSTSQPYEQVGLVIESTSATGCQRVGGTTGPINFRLDVFDFFQTNCLNLEGQSIEICNLADMSEVPAEILMDYFPIGTRFYDQNPLAPDAREIGGDSGNPFPPTTGVDFYASFTADQIGCFLSFQLKNKPLTATIEVEDTCEIPSDGLREVHLIITGLSSDGVLSLNGVLSTPDSIKRLAPGTYALSIEDGSCLIEKTIEVKPFANFEAVLQTPGSVLQLNCSGEASGVLVLEVTGNTAFNSLKLEGVAGDGTTLTRTISSPVPGIYTFEELPAGTYTWTLETVDGCLKLGQELIMDATNLPTQVDFTFTNPQSSSTIFSVGQPVQFTVTSPPIFTDAVWDFGDGQTVLGDKPLHTFQSPGVYMVTLSLMDTNGCLSSQSKEIQIAGGGLRMPQAFTPDGDGLNDFFFPVFTQVDSLSMWVFNRWGEMVFFTADKNSQGWDGYHLGRIAPPGTYSFQLEYRIKDEFVQYLRGTFLLVR